MRSHGVNSVGRGSADFPRRYGPWAAVAGASQGLGAAYARALAGRGMNLLLAARRRPPLDELAAELRARFGVEIRCMDGDLADAVFLQRFCDAMAAIDLGVLVYNAAHAPVGAFASLDPAEIFRAVDVNVRGPVTLLRSVLPSMVERGRGGVVLMSSLAGNQGSPRLSTYAATKAFNRVLAEGLWRELRDSGVHVLACCVGAVRTPGYATTAGRDAPGTLDPDRVAEYALRALGRGPAAIPGFVNRAATLFMTRILPKSAAIGIMAGSTNQLDQPEERKT